jgi:hypothetical protein
VDKEATSLDIIEAKEWRKKAIVEMTKREKEISTSQMQAVLSWLQVKDYEQEDELDRLSNYCHPGTCDWILQNRIIRSWMKRGLDQPVIWLKGKPGAGELRL